MNIFFGKRLMLIPCLFLCAQAWAQRVETVALRHQLADQIVPVLQGAFPSVGVQAYYGTLIISAPDDATYRQVMALLVKLDTPMRSLQISVEQRSQQQGSHADLGIQGRVVISNSGVGGAVVLSGKDQQLKSSNHARQTLRVVEGGEGFIQLGQQRFVPQINFLFRNGYTISQYGGQWQSAGTGFYVAPRMIGDEQVVLKLSPKSSRFKVNGRIQTQEIYSEVQGRIGEWLPVGESQQAGSSSEDDVFSRSSTARSEAYSVWVKVDFK